MRMEYDLDSAGPVILVQHGDDSSSERVERDADASEQAVLGALVGAEVVRHRAGAEHRRPPVRRVAGYRRHGIVAHRAQEHVHLPRMRTERPLKVTTVNSLVRRCFIADFNKLRCS